MKHTILSAIVLALLTACSSTAPHVGCRTDALDDSAWEYAQWISAADCPVVTGPIPGDALAADGSSWFVSTPRNAQKVVSAKWMTTGLGTYELFLNGQPVGTDFLKPGFTHYAKTKRSFTYDITQAFRCGADEENTLSAQVTPGWWGDKILAPDGHDGMRGKKVAFRGVLQLTYADGTTSLLGTNLTDWRAGVAGPVKHAGIFDGERYDARELPGYDNPDALATPEVNTEFGGEILPSLGAEICLRHDLAMAPVRAYVWKEVEGATDEAFGRVVIDREYTDGQTWTLQPEETLVVDFGQNAAAVPQFTFEAAEGTTLTCLPAELLNDSCGAKSRGMDGPEGSCHRTNLRQAHNGMRMDYTFGPTDKAVTFYPHCTFYGYRYISVTATDNVTLHALRSIPVTSITQEMETGTITTGSDDVNQLISNTLWGQRSNYLSVPTDCPQRNERLGWTADTQVFAETGTFFANTRDFFHKWMRDLRDSQSPLGGFPGVAPKAQYGAGETDMMRLGWADAGIIVPWTVWKQFGDTAIVDENWDAMNRFMDHIYQTKYCHETLAAENGNFQWADWLSYEPLESCSGRIWGDGGLKPEAVEYWNYLGASYWALDASMMRDMAAATGRDAAPYQQILDEARAYLHERFIDNNGTFRLPILNTMQTPALFALRNDIVEGEARQALIGRLKENFAQHNGCLQTGFLGTSILMPTLTANGMSDIAYDLLFQHKNPSWLYSVDNGATTIWERWNSYTIEHGMGPAGMNSFNHYAYGCVCQWLWECAAGIAADTAQPGFAHIVMAPQPDKRLGHLTATYRSAAGLIQSTWAYDGDTWTWDFTIPQGATATVTLPGEQESKDYTAGTYHIVQ